jgi:uncharacterized protein YbcI
MTPGLPNQKMAERRERSVFPVPGPRGEQASRLSNQMVALVNRYAGRGPTKCRVAINTDFVLVVMRDLLTRGEQNLVDGGQSEAVQPMRHRLHDLMAEEATRAVEQELGRTVTSYLRDCDTEANCAVLVFLLDSRPEAGHVEVGEY